MKKDSIKKNKAAYTKSTQSHIKISEIRNNRIVLKNGGMRAVLKTSSINFNLKSEVEQKSIIASYQNFINSLEFPIQILIRSKKLDIKNYIQNVEDVADKQDNKLLQEQTRNYANYIKELVEYSNIMEKSFYVIIPYTPLRSEKKGLIAKFMESFFTKKDTVSEIKQRHKEFDKNQNTITKRINIIKTGLENLGLQVKELETEDLIKLSYETYNPKSHRTARVDKVEDNNLTKEVI